MKRLRGKPIEELPAPQVLGNPSPVSYQKLREALDSGQANIIQVQGGRNADGRTMLLVTVAMPWPPQTVT